MRAFVGWRKLTVSVMQLRFDAVTYLRCNQVRERPTPLQHRLRSRRNCSPLDWGVSGELRFGRFLRCVGVQMASQSESVSTFQINHPRYRWRLYVRNLLQRRCAAYRSEPRRTRGVGDNRMHCPGGGRGQGIHQSCRQGHGVGRRDTDLAFGRRPRGVSRQGLERRHDRG